MKLVSYTFVVVPIDGFDSIRFVLENLKGSNL